MINGIPLEKKLKSEQMKKETEAFLRSGGVIEDCDISRTGGNAQAWRNTKIVSKKKKKLNG